MNVKNKKEKCCQAYLAPAWGGQFSNGLPTKLFFIGLMDVSDDRCPDNPEDSGGVCALCQEITRLRLMWPKGHHMGRGGTDLKLIVPRHF